MAGSYNIVAEQGATFHFNFRVEIGGVPWDLNTYSLRMQVRESTINSNYLLNITDAVLTSNGNVFITIPATVMDTIPEGRWVYDLELESSGGEVTRLLEGRFIVSPQVTQ